MHDILNRYIVDTKYINFVLSSIDAVSKGEKYHIVTTAYEKIDATNIFGKKEKLMGTAKKNAFFEYIERILETEKFVPLDEI